MPERPNILFLMTDEHRADIAGYEGDQVVRTPLLDELARSGVVFSNAYTPSPICVPMRQCMTAGQLPRTCGVEGFGQDLPPFSMTFPRRFAQYAYHTVCAGKLHHMGPDQMQGWTHRLGSHDMTVDPRWIEGRVEQEFERYKVAPQKWSDAKEILRAGPGKHRHGLHDHYSTRGAVEFIHEYFCDPWYDRPQGHRPLLLKHSLLQPHYPYMCDEEMFNYYLNRVEPYLDEEVFDHPFLSKRDVKVGEDVTERDVRRATAAYYGAIETCDELFTRTIEALEHSGQDLDDWIIVYTSDHGEMLGEHGIWEKQKFFEASVRVPLVVRWPKGFAGGRVVNQNVNSCDLFATLCDLADIPAPEGLDSRSLAPLLRGDDSEWNNESVSQFGPHYLMIKRDDLKYQYYGEEMPEVLFDLHADPGETRNCIDDAQYADDVRAFRSRRSELGHGPDADPDYVNAGYNNSH